MAAIIGLKEKFLPERKDLIDKALYLYQQTESWEEVERFLREEFKEELSFFRPNLFTYFLIVGGALLLPTLYLWKVVFEPGTSAYFFSRLVFILSAMFALKGIVGHYVIVFLNRDRFEAELKSLKAFITGGKDGKQPH
ncbi:hypothetical protein [Phorcysia thermohydrogeniphila]|uniref:Uncharacterized protein n=1 Tax=Phorcysia thermohydrogeniphila TaxID=936138 RepID=A0A4R1GBG6_9BACT|nr:hypothetical protein [Phorcysia thermohydrogeniphila]TCK05364.1 hypothetical protein CLV27_0791 [Phorcysia thermohydrogeniphila]